MALRNVSTAALLRLRPLVSRPFSSSPVAKGIPIFTRQSLLDGDAAVKAQLAPLDAVFWKIPSDEVRSWALFSNSMLFTPLACPLAFRGNHPFFLLCEFKHFYIFCNY